MFNRIFCAAIIAIATLVSESHGQPPSPAAQRDAMKKLDFLVGEWKGTSWTEFVPGQRTTSAGTETVQNKLDGLLLVIEGVHRNSGSDKGDIVHHAFGVMSYEEKAKQFRFQAYTSRGQYTEAKAKVGESSLEWGFNIPRFGDVRYTVKIDDKGRWFEIGEVTQDGKEWRKFFEMKLERVPTK
ncbi:MAG: hypothetical protein K1X57_20080 [Gemmataceae bacterium]|nr:hypothetical protein [Gemmataceae bacterium]